MLNGCLHAGECGDYMKTQNLFENQKIGITIVNLVDMHKTKSIKRSLRGLNFLN